MPHLFTDLDDFVPGGLGGLDDGDSVVLPWVRDDVTPEIFAAAPLRGWWTSDLYLREPREVREVAGELITTGSGGFFFAVWGRVFIDRPTEKKSYLDPDPPRLV